LRSGPCTAFRFTTTNEIDKANLWIYVQLQILIDEEGNKLTQVLSNARQVYNSGNAMFPKYLFIAYACEWKDLYVYGR